MTEPVSHKFLVTKRKTREILHAVDSELFPGLENSLNEPETNQIDLSTGVNDRLDSSDAQTLTNKANISENKLGKNTEVTEKSHVCLKRLSKPTVCVNCQQKCHCFLQPDQLSFRGMDLQHLYPKLLYW